MRARQIKVERGAGGGTEITQVIITGFALHCKLHLATRGHSQQQVVGHTGVPFCSI